MESKFIKNVVQKKQGKDDQHISGIAGMIFGILIAVEILGTRWMDGRVSEFWIGTFVVVVTLVATYILFALKVA